MLCEVTFVFGRALAHPGRRTSFVVCASVRNIGKLENAYVKSRLVLGVCRHTGEGVRHSFCVLVFKNIEKLDNASVKLHWISGVRRHTRTGVRYSRCVLFC